jgi:signal transduction histidine kinase
VAITAVEPETHELRSMAVVGLPLELEQEWRARTTGYHLSDMFADEFNQSKQLTDDVLLLDMRKPPFNKRPNPFGISLMLLAPMYVGSQLVGLLSVDHGGEAHEYTSDERALTKAVARLAALVIERERLLVDRAEARANELALREANRRMDEFLGMTSHELKTPLTSIKGNTQLAARQLRNSLQGLEKMQGMLEGTERQIRLLNRLVDDLLDIARTQGDHLELQRKMCDLATITREAVEEQRKVWSARTIRLEMDEGIVLPIYADADRIGQVITNYLTNALKYSAEGKPVDMVVRREGEEAVLSVRDEGPGLSEEQQAHVWERFQRVEGVEVRSNPHGSTVGLGLGLYISKIIIEQHGGGVGVQSIPGEGSTFWFRLPLQIEGQLGIK